MRSVKVLFTRARFATSIGAMLFAVFFGTLFAAPAGAAVTETSAAQAGHIASSATAIPNNQSGCNPDPFSSTAECTTVIGKGLKIRSVYGDITNDTNSAIRDVHIEIFYGPGHKRIHDCGSFNLPPLSVSSTCSWKNPHPKLKVKAGNYCTEAWHKNRRNNYSVLSVECIDIHK